VFYEDLILRQDFRTLY